MTDEKFTKLAKESEFDFSKATEKRRKVKIFWIFTVYFVEIRVHHKITPILEISVRRSSIFGFDAARALCTDAIGGMLEDHDKTVDLLEGLNLENFKITNVKTENK